MDSEPNTSDVVVPDSAEEEVIEIEPVETIEIEENGVVHDDSVQISPTIPASDDRSSIIELGDYVVFETSTYGQIIGTVMYRSLERISIKPDGISHYLQHFNITQEDGEDIFEDKDGITAIYIIEKRKFSTFVEQQNFRVGQMVDTFNSEHEHYRIFKIIDVDETEDAITLEDADDKDQPIHVIFKGMGIELDEPFSVIRIRAIESDEKVEDVPPLVEEEEEEVLEEEDLGIVDVGVVEMAIAKVYKEAAAYEQRIPDDLQKIDALNDFISGLDPAVQKDSRAVRSIRILVETLFNLKQETVQYQPDGSIDGPKTISVKSIRELIERVPIPMGRPILSVVKKEYLGVSGEDGEVDEIPENSKGTSFTDFFDELNRMNKPISNMVSTGGVVREWKDTQDFLSKYLSPWKSDGMERLWRAIVDSEFFRSPEMDAIEEDANPLMVPGYVNIAKVGDRYINIFDKVEFGLERALSTTFRKGADRSKQILIKEDAAPLSSYLIFPSKMAHTMGSTRSRKLVVDSYRSMLPRTTMKDMIENLGGPKRKGTSNDLLMLDIRGNQFGNLALKDYIDGMTIPALGMDDTFDTLTHYGLDQLELQPDIVNVLIPKIEAYQSQLISTLAVLRNMITANPPAEPKQTTMIDHAPFFEFVKSEPMLLEALNEYQRIQPTLAHSDIGQVSHLMKHVSNYFQVAAGNNQILKGKAFLQAGLTEYLNQLQIANQIRYNEKNAGMKPKKNTCAHVTDLVSVRRVQDDSERFFQLTKWFKRYQGARSQNWIDCNVCKEHLLCIHERLQIQAYLNPKEKASIEKQMVLSFAGGQFQGKYICRNCGQGIRDLDFDNNIEFDDNGKPKSGRAVLVDEDALLEEKIDNLISPKLEAAPQIQLKLTANETKLYHVIRELSERVGVELDTIGFRNVIDDTMRYMNSIPSREDYGSRKGLAYEVFVVRFMVCACATYLLIEIQSKIPSYLVRYTLMGCPDPGFGGVPLSTDNKNIQGVLYIACAISTMTRRDPPWSETGFQQISDDKKRLMGVVTYINNILNHAQQNADVQGRLSLKRRYNLDVLGQQMEGDGSFSKEDIMPTFLPEQTIITPEEAAKDVIQPEVVEMMGEKGKPALVKLWIRQSHAIARSTAQLVRSTPHSETTCCTTNLVNPGAYWNENKNLPELDGRSLKPNIQGSMLLTNFVPRDASLGVVKPDEDLYYRLFLKCCFTGPRIGHSHEPGLTNRCLWCGLQFPTHPKIMDSNTEGRAALSEVETSTTEFIRLLDAIHNVNRVTSIPEKEISSFDHIMKQLSEITPAPLADWKNIIEQTAIQCKRLEHDAQRDEIAQALGLVSESTREAEALIFRGKTMPLFRDFIEQKITELSWTEFFNVLQIYFVTPIQRFLTNFNSKLFVVPREMEKELSAIHVEKDITPILEHEMEFVKKKEADMKNASLDFARSKLSQYIDKLRVILPFKNIVRPIIVPGKEKTLAYIQKAIFYGTLATLLDSGDIPKDSKRVSAISAASDPSAVYILNMIRDCLKKYQSEGLSYNDNEIKELIEARNEKERVNVVNEMDKLTDEERQVELMNKRLGLGKWAVGGTKLIYAYDKDYYDLERQKRENAGIFDSPGLPSGEQPLPSGRETDELGLPEFGDQSYEEDGGYDFNQHPDDDQE